MKIMMNTGLKSLAAASLLIGAGFAAPALAGEYSWRAVTHQLPGTARYDGTMPPFTQCVSEASGGRLEIQAFGGGVLFPISDSLNAIRNGIVEMGMVWSGFWAGVNPVFALAGSRPGDPITSFSENFYRAERLHAVVAAAYEAEGVISLGAFDFASAEILNSAVEIRSLKDFRGKTVRSAGLGARFYGELGASAMTLTGAEIYQALQLGTVDMAEFNDWLVNMEMGFHEVTDYVIEPALHTGSTDDKELIVNPDAWNTLPEALQNIVLACRDRARYLSSIAYGIANEQARQKWKAGGVRVIRLSEEDIARARRVAARVILEFAERNPGATEYVRIYATTLRELGYTDLARTLGAE